MAYYNTANDKCLLCMRHCEPPSSSQENCDPTSVPIPVPEKRPSTEPDSVESAVGEGANVNDQQNVLSVEQCSCYSHPSRFLGSLTLKWEDIKSFRTSLKYIFVLRKLLDYPRNKCVQYLRRRCSEADDEGNATQNGWFSICEDCSKIVEEGHAVHHKIEELQKRLTELKSGLKRSIMSAHENNERLDEERNQDQEVVSIFSEVRGHFLPQTELPPPDQSIVKVEFNDQDDDAAEMMGDIYDGGAADSDWAPPDPDSFEDEEHDVKPCIKPFQPPKVVQSLRRSSRTTRRSGRLQFLEPSPEPLHEDDDVAEQVTSFETLNRSRRLHFLESSPDESPNEDDDGPEQVAHAQNEVSKRKRKLDSLESVSKKSHTAKGDVGGPCSTCGVVYVTKHRLREHEELHLKEFGVVKCDRCPFVCKTSKGLLLHSYKDHGEKPVYSPKTKKGKKNNDFRCSKCDVIYKTAHRLKEHEDLHFRDDLDLLRCQQCEYVCLIERGMKVHVTRYHKDTGEESDTHEGVAADDTLENEQPVYSSKAKKVGKDNDYSCSECGVKYKTAHRLKEHENLHFRDDLNLLRCQQCEYVCLIERGMKVHVTRYHKDTAEESDGQEGVAGDDALDNEMEMISGEPNVGGGATNVKDKGKESETYRCSICNASYKMRERLKQHKRLHKNSKALKCARCPFVCLTEKHLKTHVNRVHAHDYSRPKPLKCDLCPAVYHTKHRFKEHYQLHESSTSVTCDKCRWVFSSKSKLERHKEFRHLRTEGGRPPRRRIRPKDGPFNCDHCPSIYQNRHRLKEHVHIYHRDKLIQCSSCKTFYESERILRDHAKLCRGPREEPDHDAFPPPSKNKEKEQFPCDTCSAVFPSESKLRYHKARAHSSTHNVCKECGYKAHGPGQLRLHMQKHTKEKMYMCEICSKTFVSPTYLTAHKKKEHYEELGMKPIKCDQCDLILPSQSMLKYHVKKVHEKDFKFFCEICGKGFLFASILRNHSIIHSTERNQICQYCGAAYVHNRVLLDHMKNHHPEEYAAAKGVEVPQSTVNNQGPFICKFCNAEFPMRWNLHNHLKTHTEIYDKYKCAICGKGYSSQAGVKRHEETAHMTRSFNCANCGKTFSCKDYLRYHVKNHCRKKDNESTSSAAGGQDSSKQQGTALPSTSTYLPNLHFALATGAMTTQQLQHGNSLGTRAHQDSDAKSEASTCSQGWV